MTDFTSMKRKKLEAFIADKDNSKADRKAAKAELAGRDAAIDPISGETVAEVREADAPDATLDLDAEIKARLDAKRVRRAELAALADTIDRSDDAAVRAYNEELPSLGGGTLLTSETERAVAEETFSVPTKVVVGTPDPDLAQPLSVEGNGVVVTPSPPVEFASPSEAPKDDYETNGLGQYLVKRPSDGKLVGYTRTTTYIDNLDDKSALEKWKLRVLLEGIVANEDATASGANLHDPLATSRVRDLVHQRDLAIKKARKADKRGKLEPGELATTTEEAWRVFKRAMDDLARELLDLGGVHEKAVKGTSLHALCETYDQFRYGATHGDHEAGMLAVADCHPEATPADLADVEAYAAAIERAGITILPDLIEQPIVVDELSVAGRADRFVLYKPAGAARAKRVVLDVKSGRIDFGAGKIAQQLAMYARGEGYDLDTHERKKIGASKDIGLVLHLPAGSGHATIHEVDLKKGAEGIALSGKVRAWRRESRKAIDTTRDVARGDAS